MPALQKPKPKPTSKARGQECPRYTIFFKLRSNGINNLRAVTPERILKTKDLLVSSTATITYGTKVKVARDAKRGAVAPHKRAGAPVSI